MDFVLGDYGDAGLGLQRDECVVTSMPCSPGSLSVGWVEAGKVSRERNIAVRNCYP